MAKESKTDAVIKCFRGQTLERGWFEDIYGGVCEFHAIGSIRYERDGKIAMLPADVRRAARAQIRQLNKARAEQGL